MSQHVSSNDYNSSGKHTFITYYADSKAIVSSLESRECLPAFKFINHSSTPVSLMWLDFGGRAVYFGIVPAGGHKEMHTYLTHPWILRAIFEPEITPSLIFRETGHGVGFPNRGGSLNIDVAQPIPWSSRLSKDFFELEPSFRVEVKSLLLSYIRLRQFKLHHGRDHGMSPMNTPMSRLQICLRTFSNKLLAAVVRRGQSKGTLPAPKGTKFYKETGWWTRKSDLGSLPPELIFIIIGFLAPVHYYKKPIRKEDVIGRPAMLSDELETFLGTEQLALQRAL